MGSPCVAAPGTRLTPDTGHRTRPPASGNRPKHGGFVFECQNNLSECHCTGRGWRSDPCGRRFGSVAGTCTQPNTDSAGCKGPPKEHGTPLDAPTEAPLFSKGFLRSEPRKSAISGPNRRNLVKHGLGVRDAAEVDQPPVLRCSLACSVAGPAGRGPPVAADRAWPSLPGQAGARFGHVRPDGLGCRSERRPGRARGVHRERPEPIRRADRAALACGGGHARSAACCTRPHATCVRPAGPLAAVTGIAAAPVRLAAASIRTRVSAIP